MIINSDHVHISVLHATSTSAFRSQSVQNSLCLTRQKKMADAAGRIPKLEVRCACGKGCENAEAYSRHKLSCKIHQKQNVLRTRPGLDRNFATTPASASGSPSLQKFVACVCGRKFKNDHTLRSHGGNCAVRKQQANAHPTSPDPSRILDGNTNVYSLPAIGELPISSAKVTTKKIPCLCGQSFANEKALANHLRYSKTHQSERQAGSSASMSKAPGSVPLKVPYPPVPLNYQAPGAAPGTIPSSVLSPASLLTCICGQRFETERIMDLHKRDSIFHKQQTARSQTQPKQLDDSLISSFASMNLVSISPQTTPSTAGLSCFCGRTFIDQEALHRHKRDARHHAWPDNGKTTGRKFNTAQPQYQKEEDIHEMAAFLAARYE